MALTRTHYIIGAVSLVLLLSLGYGVFLLVGPSAKYRGLTTYVQVDMDPATRAYVENQLRTAQAALAADQADGGEVNLNRYDAVGNYALVLGDLITSREAYEAELKGNPLNYAATNSYGNVLAKMGDYSGARKAFEHAIELSAGQGPESFYINLVELLEVHFPADQDSVKKLLEVYVAKRGQTSWNMVQLGRWYQNAGDCQRAIDHFSVAKTLSPKNQSIADELQALKTTCIVK
ncbi:MAG: hypothetical protein WC813_03000 [Patescibacteria group bacterium]